MVRVFRWMTAALLLAVVAAGPARSAGVVSPLVSLSSAGIDAPAGVQAALFSAPVILGSAFFDPQTGALVGMSAESGAARLVDMDAAGNALTRLRSDALAGVSSRGGMVAGQDILATLDYWPDGGTYLSGLQRIAPDGSHTPWPLTANHGGAGSLTPAGRRSLFLAMPVPAGISLPNGTRARALRSNYTFGPVGNLVYDADGNLLVNTASPNRRQLARITRAGVSSPVASSEILVGANLRSVAPYQDRYVVAVDYAPTASNTPGNIYLMAADGSYTEWGLTQGHSGISSLVAAPQGGYYFTDFENDGVWYIRNPGEPEQRVQDTPPAALWSVAASATQGLVAINWIPGEWWSNGGVNAVYRVNSGASDLVAVAPEGSRLFGVAAAAGGVFGDACYITDQIGGRIFRLEADNTLTPVITGLTHPTGIVFDPRTGDMVVLCDSQYLIWIGTDPAPMAPADDPPTDFPGLYFSDFENDNIWLVPGAGQGEIPLVDSDVPAGMGAVAFNDVEQCVYALNWQGSGWPLGGENALLRIDPNGRASQVLLGSYAGVAMSRGGAFGQALYLTDAPAGQVLRWDGLKATTVISGLVSPSTLAFDDRGRLAVLCDGGRQVAWFGPQLPAPAAGEPGTVGTFFFPTEQPFADAAQQHIQARTVTLGLPGDRSAYAYAVSKAALTGDFDLVARISMPDLALESGQNRGAAVQVVSDVAGQRDNQIAYIGILQKTIGYAGTAGQYRAYTDMRVNGGWGRFSAMDLPGPEAVVRLTRQDGVIRTFVQRDSQWVQVSTATDGFADRVRIVFQLDTTWDATAPLACTAVFEGLDIGTAGSTAVAADEGEALPTGTRLLPAYPNPFNASSVIGFALAQSGPLRLELLNCAGQTVAVLADGPWSAGRHEVIWQGRDGQGRALGSGVYLCRLTAAGVQQTQRLVLLR